MKRKNVLTISAILLAMIPLGMLIAGFQEHGNNTTLANKDTYKILCLGESTTAGGYPEYLEQELNSRNTGRKFILINKGIPGINTNFILSKLEENLETYKPDIVVTMMGINDSREDIVYEHETGFFTSINTHKLIRSLKLHLRNYLKEVKDRSAQVEENKKKVDIPENITTKANSGKEASYMEHRYRDAGDSYKNEHKYEEAEKMYKKVLGIDPNDVKSLMALGDCYRAMKKFEEAQKVYKKGLELNPKKAWNYKVLGDCYQDMGKYEDAEKMYGKEIEMDPHSDQGYKDVGDLYRNEGKYEESEKMYKKAIQINPKEAMNYMALGDSYQKMKKFEEAEKMCKKVIELNPKQVWNYRVLGECYLNTKRYEDAQKLYAKAIEMNPNEQSLYANLAEIYLLSKKYEDLEEILEKAVQLDFKVDRAYRLLYELSKKYCKKEVSDKYLDKINEFESKSYYLTTKVNYNKLVNIVKKKGIKHVCVQYPVRSVRQLERLLVSKDGIVFVDNEKIFKDAVNKEGYEKYFDDRFAGDFGHFTQEGNKLLGRNIANTIAKEVFNK